MKGMQLNEHLEADAFYMATRDAARAELPREFENFEKSNTTPPGKYHTVEYLKSALDRLSSRKRMVENTMPAMPVAPTPALAATVVTPQVPHPNITDATLQRHLEEVRAQNREIVEEARAAREASDAAIKAQSEEFARQAKARQEDHAKAMQSLRQEIQNDVREGIAPIERRVAVLVPKTDPSFGAAQPGTRPWGGNGAGGWGQPYIPRRQGSWKGQGKGDHVQTGNTPRAGQQQQQPRQDDPWNNGGDPWSKGRQTQKGKDKGKGKGKGKESRRGNDFEPGTPVTEANTFNGFTVNQWALWVKDRTEQGQPWQRIVYKGTLCPFWAMGTCTGTDGNCPHQCVHGYPEEQAVKIRQREEFFALVKNKVKELLGNNREINQDVVLMDNPRNANW